MCHLGDIVLHTPTGITGVIGALGAPKKKSADVRDCVIIVDSSFKDYKAVFPMQKDYIKQWKAQRNNFTYLSKLKPPLSCIWVPKEEIEIIMPGVLVAVIKKIRKEIGL
jgi:hypothetical protein